MKDKAMQAARVVIETYHGSATMFPYMYGVLLRYVAVVLLGVGVAVASASGQLQTAKPRAAASRSNTTHPLEPALRRARSSLNHIQSNVQDYTARFVKRHRVDGELTDPTWANLKIRHRRMKGDKISVPTSVYLGFLKPASVKGREVIWVEGRYDGKLIAHETGLKNLMNVKLDPKGTIAMHGERYPITEIGMENLAMKLVEAASRDKKYGECLVRVHRNAKIGDHACDMFEVTHPVQRAHFDFYRTRVFFSKTLNMPIRYVSWSWPAKPDGEPVLEEEYTYLNVKVNVGLTDLDFDPDNPHYQFW
jgi:hypothetical protein